MGMKITGTTSRLRGNSMEQKLQLTGKALWLRDDGEYRYSQEGYIYACAFLEILETMPPYARAWSRLN